MFDRILRTADALADFRRQVAEFGWVVYLSMRSRYHR